MNKLEQTQFDGGIQAYDVKEYSTFTCDTEETQYRNFPSGRIPGSYLGLTNAEKGNKEIKIIEPNWINGVQS